MAAVDDFAYVPFSLSIGLLAVLMLRKPPSASESGKAANQKKGKGHLVWRLQKYARLAPHRGRGSNNGEGTWQHYDDEDLDGQLRLSILDSSHLLVGIDREVYENLMMWNAHKWLKVARKADSLLFVCVNVGQPSQRFRVRFHAIDSKSSEDVCMECAAILSQYTTVKDLAGSGSGTAAQKNDSQDGSQQRAVTGGDDMHIPLDVNASTGDTHTAWAKSQDANVAEANVMCSDINGSERLGLGTLAGQLVQPSELDQPLRQAYKAVSDPQSAWPTGQLTTMLHLCLTDSNFPAFVDQVDKELTKLMSND